MPTIMIAKVLLLLRKTMSSIAQAHDCNDLQTYAEVCCDTLRSSPPWGALGRHTEAKPGHN